MVRGASAAALVAGLPHAGSRAGGSLPYRRIVALLGGPPGWAMAIGSVYARREDLEGDATSWWRALVRLHAPATDDPGEGTELFAALERTIVAEFATGVTTVVDGWVVSKTEARLCAVVAGA